MVFASPLLHTDLAKLSSPDKNSIHFFLTLMIMEKGSVFYSPVLKQIIHLWGIKVHKLILQSSGNTYQLLILETVNPHSCISLFNCPRVSSPSSLEGISPKGVLALTSKQCLWDTWSSWNRKAIHKWLPVFLWFVKGRQQTQLSLHHMEPIKNICATISILCQIWDKS